MASKLPTKEQLQQLLETKGRDALVWYAWRNALRALPLLGHIPLIKIWPENTLKHTIATCRIALLGAIAHQLEINFSASAADSTAAATAASTASSDDAIAASAVYSAYAASAAATDDDDASSDVATVAAVSASAAAKMDYKFLIKSDLHELHNHWFLQPLWVHSQWSGMILKPKLFKLNSQKLSHMLVNLGLDFMAEDLNRLWQGEENPIQPHWNNYAKTLSEENFKSAASFREVILGQSEEINAVRVLLLGPGGAGKTTLAQRLQNKAVSSIASQNKATIGIDYLDHQALPLTGEQSAFSHCEIPKNLQLYLWDFGGQTLFQGLHKSFLHENCVYVLVVDSRHEQAPDEWLQQINHLMAQHKSPPVLIVSNEYENCQQRQNAQRLKREFPSFDLQFFNFPCNQAESQGLDDFKQDLLNTTNKSRHIVAKNLFNAADHIDKIFQTHAVIDILSLEQQLDNYINHMDIDILIQQLEGLGRLINVEKSDYQARYCLNPAWVVDHAYHLLYLNVLKDSNGAIQSRLLKRAAWHYFSKNNQGKTDHQPPLNTENIDDLLRFLQKSQVCKRLKEDQLFFPDLAAINEPPSVQKDLQAYQDRPYLVEFHLPYLPISLAAHLVCHWLENNEDDKVIINSIEDVWREGFILSHQDNKNNRLIVQYQSRKAMLLVHCLGEPAAWSDLLNAIWQGLIKEIKPIKAEQILVFVGIDRNISNFDYLRDKSTSSEELATANSHIKILKEIIGENMSGDNIFNAEVKNSQILMGNKNRLTQNNTSSDRTVTEENRAELLQEAIKFVRNEYDLSGRKFLKLAEIQIQIEENNNDNDLYNQLGMKLGTVADVITIAMAIAAMIGLT